VTSPGKNPGPLISAIAAHAEPDSAANPSLGFHLPDSSPRPSQRATDWPISCRLPIEATEKTLRILGNLLAGAGAVLLGRIAPRPAGERRLEKTPRIPGNFLYPAPAGRQLCRLAIREGDSARDRVRAAFHGKDSAPDRVGWRFGDETRQPTQSGTDFIQRFGVRPRQPASWRRNSVPDRVREPISSGKSAGDPSGWRFRTRTHLPTAVGTRITENRFS